MNKLASWAIMPTQTSTSIIPWLIVEIPSLHVWICRCVGIHVHTRYFIAHQAIFKHEAYAAWSGFSCFVDHYPLPAPLISFDGFTIHDSTGLHLLKCFRSRVLAGFHRD